MPIHFGTDGWRAVISDSFTFDNLRIVAQAIADAVASDHWDKSGNGGEAPNPNKIVIGFDTRFLSDRYAGEVARVLAANGFSVLLAQSDAPTPHWRTRPPRHQPRDRQHVRTRPAEAAESAVDGVSRL